MALLACAKGLEGTAAKRHDAADRYIPSVPGYGGTSAESTVALADAALREELHSQYPAMWERMQERRAYLKDVLGIEIPEDVLHMSTTVA